MQKYKGKYRKCRQCKHVRDIGMWIVWVTESCKNPRVIRFSSGLAVDKPTCEECQCFEKEKVK